MDSDANLHLTPVWRGKVIAGALLMCVAAVAAQFSTKDFWGNERAMRAVALAAPLTGVLAIFLLTSPPGGRRSILGVVCVVVARLAAAVVIALMMLSLGRRSDRLDTVVSTITFLCTPLAGVATYLHLARLLRARRRHAVAAAFGLLAALLVAGAVLFA